jgi:hypothetical protein
MDSITAAVAINQSGTQQQIALAILKQAAQSQQMLVNVLLENAQAGQALAANPSHLGQTLDTFA